MTITNTTVRVGIIERQIRSPAVGEVSVQADGCLNRVRIVCRAYQAGGMRQLNSPLPVNQRAGHELPRGAKEKGQGGERKG